MRNGAEGKDNVGRVEGGKRREKIASVRRREKGEVLKRARKIGINTGVMT